MKKLYFVRFLRPDKTTIKGRWRKVFADSFEDAPIEGLRDLRDGSLSRFAKRCSVINAHVYNGKIPCHPNGSPVMVHTFNLNLKLN